MPLRRPRKLSAVRDDEIIVTLPGTSYTVTYYKPAKSPQLLAKRIAHQDDRHTGAWYLDTAWHHTIGNDVITVAMRQPWPVQIVRHSVHRLRDPIFGGQEPRKRRRVEIVILGSGHHPVRARLNQRRID